MKKLLSIGLVAALLGTASVSNAQNTTDTVQSDAHKVGQKIKKGGKKAWQGTKKGAKAVGNKTAELASEGKAKLTDKKSKEWTGPDGQAIYVDDGSKYYWINNKGGKVYVTQDELKAKH